MFLKYITLQNFRTYKKASLELGVVNVLVGCNTQGKTNFLEAISYLTFGKSFRSSDKELIKWGEDFFRIEAKKEDNKKIEIFYGINPSKKIIKINNQTKRQADLFGQTQAVLFSPEDINLITAAPEKKRRYVDMVISQADKTYLYDLINYKKILKQRNSLLLNLREGRGNIKELEVWSEKLVEKGLSLVKKRFDFFRAIEELLKKTYFMFDEKTIWLKYENSIDNTLEGFRVKLKKSESLDIISGKTSVGPHRDFFTFYINNKKLESTGSRGEFRSTILSLKFIEMQYLEKKTGNKPLFLLDDVFSELDINRRDALLKMLEDYQTIITSTDINYLNPLLLNKAVVFKIENNQCQKVKKRIRK